MNLKFLIEQTLQGISKGKTTKDIAKKHHTKVDKIKKQLKLGSKVEKEHTKNKTTAKKIAKDHVWENPKYYSKLKKIETKK